MICEEANNTVMDKINLPENIAPIDPSKKKKKKRVAFADNVISESKSDNTKVEEVRSHEQQSQQPLCPWDGTDRDYLYEELLNRVYGGVGERHNTLMKLPVPQVLRQGSKKTVLVNFMDCCRAMHRQPDHLSRFMEVELLANVNFNESKQLVVNGRFQPKSFEKILRNYANEYVVCNGCKSSNTNLHKENRLMFLRCNQCGSGRSVSLLTAVFRAQIGRRAGA
ncbi:hypothetical protein SOVF_019770 isoform B [Spinacia oleracea]|uniref:Eukaryotic translation initiation factor 2 subunit beta isoform X2 n=1 Tax=Spinacia oleracea TaxID=3562 RepID=A0ABM3R5N7_SPIOL|nr:eukaryotic translation initiation factor 2 subunit beta-like isoform X2 [Spinacia oleracea]KNA23975.1 hypothetical protein SOVF_019770 isoform B [Spinacia oleracea]